MSSELPAELITYYDDDSGERVGLTSAEVGSWSAATASLLTSECGLAAGGQVGVLLPPHWQTAVVLLGAWSAGMEVSFRGWGAAGLSPAGAPLDATFVASRRAGSWLDDVPGGRHQFSLFGNTPSGYRDYVASVRAHLGSAAPSWSVAVDDVAAAGGVTFGEYGAVALEMASSRGISRGDRVLIDTAVSEEPLIWLMAPLSAGASIVLCANPDRARVEERIASERVTKVFAAAG
ncbi:TIGR03089 family protein [Actinoplanes sp. NPDC051513]|uniref:TIGR03089 family protein n=1 Tax=Actinoplanes sp. NPDC051513 TaxID=3363908 RepID=UPI0037BC81CD